MRRQSVTKTYRPFRRAAVSLLVLCAAAVLAGALPGASQATAAFVGTTTQVTNKAGVQDDPSISGDILVFTDASSGNGDVHYSELNTPGSDVAVTSAAGNQRLHDVSGHIIVYTDQSSPPERVFAYDVTTATSVQVSGGSDRNPRIDGSVVAFERGTPGDTHIVAVDLTNPGVEIEVSAPGGAVETNPVVSGTHVVYERRVGIERDIVLFDLSDGSESVIAGTAADERRPDVDGDTVVYDVVSAALDTDIAIHDLSTSATEVIALSGNQSLPHVSNGFVAYDHELDGNVDVRLRHLATGETVVVAGNPGTDFLNDIDGNRVVYSSNADGDFDLYVYEFTLQQADIEITPGSYDFGNVNVGSSATATVTISNVGAQPLVVSSLAIAPSSGPFGISSAPSLPATVPAGASVAVQVAFAPTASGAQSGTLTIGSDDLDEGTVEVALTGTGAAAATPAQLIVALIDKTLAFVDRPALKAPLKAKLEQAASALIANNKPAACAGLSLYIVAVKLAPASALTAAEKSELVADATAIKAVIGCP